MLTVSVSAKTSVIETAANAGLTIQFPAIDYYPIGKNFTLNFHVYNSSGFAVSDLSCLFHLYDSMGDHKLLSLLKYNPADEDYYIIINDTFLLEQRVYSYIVQCNGTEAGFLSTGFRTSPDGVEPPEDLTPMAMIIAIPLLLAFLMGFCIVTLEDGHAALKVFLFIGQFVSVAVSYNYAVFTVSRYFLDSAMSDFIASDYAWFGWFIYIIIVYFILHWIIQITTNLNERRTRKFRFEDGEERRK